MPHMTPAEAADQAGLAALAAILHARLDGSRYSEISRDEIARIEAHRCAMPEPTAADGAQEDEPSLRQAADLMYRHVALGEVVNIDDWRRAARVLVEHVNETPRAPDPSPHVIGKISDDPEDGHRFDLTAKIGGSYRVGDGPHHDAPDDDLPPWTVTVRAWNLRAALRAAVGLPLDAWERHETTPVPPPASGEAAGDLRRWIADQVIDLVAGDTAVADVIGDTLADDLAAHRCAPAPADPPKVGDPVDTPVDETDSRWGRAMDTIADALGAQGDEPSGDLTPPVPWPGELVDVFARITSVRDSIYTNMDSGQVAALERQCDEVADALRRAAVGDAFSHRCAPAGPEVSTEAAGELAAIADQLALRAAEVRGLTAGQSHRERQIQADLIERHAAALRAHRCAPAGPTDEELAAKLDKVIPGGGGWLNVAEVRNALRARHAPAPADPPKVGDPVETPAQLTALPVGTFLVNDRGVHGVVRDDGGGRRHVAWAKRWRPGDPARILDLPDEETS